MLCRGVFYTISGQGVEYTTGSVTVTKDGTNSFSVTLTVTSDTAWDGSKTEILEERERRVIRSPPARAGLVRERAKTADVSSVLTADIKLGKYAWLDDTGIKVGDP